jgi:hypothetical protein
VSNYLAIATVTATLKRTLDEALAAQVPGAVQNASVTTTRPEEAGNGSADRRGVNIYLYQATPNAAIRNAELPTRRSDGSLAQRPQAALDLYYLMTFYGDEAAQEPQRLMGTTVSTLNSRPVLSRDAIRDAIDQAIIDDPSTYLQFSDLVDQIDLVKFSPLPLNLEELSKLWSVFFQTPYVLSVAYQGTVVLIESDLSPKSALPVRLRNLYVAPFRSPFIDRVVSAAGMEEPITSGTTLLIQGSRLRADLTEVRVGGVTVTPSAAQITDLEITLPVPPGVPAGIQGVQVIQPFEMGAPPAPHEGVESNAAPFVFRPTITDPVTTAPGSGAGIVDVTVPLDPPVGKAQRVVLLMNEFQAPTTRAPFAYSFEAPSRNQPVSPPTVTAITTPTIGVEPADYLVRVQVDGAESLLGVDGTGQFASPLVTFA